mmetsp:Transcript_9986/g.21962  ORF Transcript_9986/g.21962 Transcript_9986/m.21962 type:complete len:547 (-) Transcript_9986:355-1995(-)
MTNFIETGDEAGERELRQDTSSRLERRMPYYLTAIFAVLALIALIPIAQNSKNRPITGNTVVRGYGRDLDSPKGAKEIGPLQILQRQLQRTPAYDVGARQTLHFSLGRLLHEKGYYTSALEQYDKAESLAKTNKDRSKIILNRAQAEFARGRVATSREIVRQLLAVIDQKAVGELPGLLHALGDTEVELGMIDKGLKTYDRALEAATLNDDTQEIILIMADKGEALTRLGKSQEALATLTQARRKTEALGKSLQGLSPLVGAKVDSYLGAVLHGLGSSEKAKTYYQKALAVQEKQLAPSHPDLISTRLSFARLWHDFGDAPRCLREFAEVERIILDGPNEGPGRSRALLLMSDFSRLVGHLEEAHSKAQEGIKLQKDVFDTREHPEIAIANANLGSVLHDLGRYTEAKKHYQDALELQLKLLGGEHPEVAATHNSLGTLYQDLHMVPEAVDHFTKCLEIQRKTVSESSPDVANTYNNLATVLFQQGRAPDARELLKKAVAILDALGVAASSPERALYEENLQEVEEKLRSHSQSKSDMGFEGSVIM